MATFFEEHMHTDDEVRFFVEGSGYFDVRDADDQWLRVAAEAGDLLVLPAGIYHRFTADQKVAATRSSSAQALLQEYAKVIRLFSGAPVWTAHRRPADEQPMRRAYVQALAVRTARLPPS